MNADITFCSNGYRCSLRDRCKRAKPPHGEGALSFADFAPGEDCEYFMTFDLIDAIFLDMTVREMMEL